jgi:hypothetical protein
MNPFTFTPLNTQRQKQCAACSASIPIPSKGLIRTPSELQLLEDEAMAEYRDYCMYNRIVNGIAHSKNKQGGGDMNRSLANADSVQNINRARHLPVLPDVVSSSLQDDDDEFRQEWQLCSNCGGTVEDSSAEDDEGIFILDM